MNYNCFLKDVTQRVCEAVSGTMTVEVGAVAKNNGVTLDSLMIHRPGETVCPNIYINPLYEQYLNGATVDQIVERILLTYRSAVPAAEVDPDNLLNPEIILSQVVYRLVNYKKNERLLEDIPYKPVLDLALIYYVMVHTEEFGDGAIMVRNDLLAYYNLTKEEVDRAAKENTARLLPADFMGIRELMREMGEIIGVKSYKDLSLEEEAVASPLYVLTNRQRLFGAYYMTDESLLSEISRKLDSDLFLIPSSVHECMVVPTEIWEEKDTLSDMVREINHTQVSEQDFLADTIYRYNAGEKRLVVA